MNPALVLLADVTELPPGDCWLRPPERAALRRHRAPKRRRDFRLGRFAAKHALALLAGGEGARGLERFDVRPAENGSPLAFHDGAPLAVAVSLSHSHGWASAAVQGGTGPLGCDLERVETRSRPFLEDYFTEGEQTFVAAGTEDEAPLRATLVWSAKESVMKALGEGLRLAPAAVRTAPAWEPSSRAGWRTFSVLAPPGAGSLRGFWRVVGDFVLTVAGGSDEPRLVEGVPWP